MYKTFNAVQPKVLSHNTFHIRIESIFGIKENT